MQNNAYQPAKFVEARNPKALNGRVIAVSGQALLNCAVCRIMISGVVGSKNQGRRANK